MKVAELIAPHQFRLVETPEGEPGPGEVLVRVDAVGICGSDLHSYAEGAVGDTPCEYPQVLGHEPAGTVVRAGAGAAGWARGDRAALEPALYCYHCEFCRAGHHNVCQHIRFLSMPGDPGFFREYAVLPAGNLLAIPAHLGAAEATLVEPLAVVLHSLRFADIHPGETAVVFGAGPIGLLTVICLKLAGAGRVWSFEPVAARREMARQAGADAAIDPTAADPAREILHDTGRRGVDVAIDCATKGDTVNQCLHAVRNAGRVVITGIPSEVHVPVEFSPLRRKELAVYTVRRSNHESARALELLLGNIPRFAALITHTRPLERIGEAFGMVEQRSHGAGKVVIRPGE
ncbi:MAG TPA: alcohol dehydrogenase catalytic domain-containing protein [Bryobacteraceae bacterium]|nr:alcohol dehydrogenase catalytic domain-containing protein [Bryobacteraceae bacterium]